MNEEQRLRKNEYNKAYSKAQRLKDPEACREKDRIKGRNRRNDAVTGEKLRAWDRANYAANREHIRAKSKEWYANNIGGIRDKARADYHKKYAAGKMKDRLRSAFHAAKSRAKKRGLDFNLTLADLGEPTHCAVTGIEFDMTRSFIHGNIFVPSIDRIDPKLGYVKSNVRIICHGYNLAKHTGTDENVVKLARAIVAMADKV